MLLIDTKENQTIRIGNGIRITVTKIDQEHNLVGFSIECDGCKHERQTKLGVANMVAANVKMVAIRIAHGRNITVTLGFDAPRSIHIKGTWMNTRKQRTAYTDLCLMNTKDLIRTAQCEARTDLERVLIDTLSTHYNAQ